MCCCVVILFVYVVLLCVLFEPFKSLVLLCGVSDKNNQVIDVSVVVVLL